MLEWEQEQKITEQLGLKVGDGPAILVGLTENNLKLEYYHYKKGKDLMKNAPSINLTYSQLYGFA